MFRVLQLRRKTPEARLKRWRRVKYGTLRSVVIDDCIQTPYATDRPIAA